MLKIICTVLLSSVVSMINITSYAANDKLLETKDILKELEIVDFSLFENESNITRNDSVALIMRAIGVPENLNIESYTGRKIFSDFDTDTFNKIKEYHTQCKFIDGTNYVGLAVEFTDVVFGECQQADGAIYFDFTRPVTTKEAVAFMVRCLKKWRYRFV